MRLAGDCEVFASSVGCVCEESDEINESAKLIVSMAERAWIVSV